MLCWTASGMPSQPLHQKRPPTTTVQRGDGVLLCQRAALHIAAARHACFRHHQHPLHGVTVRSYKTQTSPHTWHTPGTPLAGCSQLVVVWRRPLAPMGAGGGLPRSWAVSGNGRHPAHCTPIGCPLDTTRAQGHHRAPGLYRGPPSAATPWRRRFLSAPVVQRSAPVVQRSAFSDSGAQVVGVEEDVRNVCMVVSYDGTRFKGFQLQVVWVCFGQLCGSFLDSCVGLFWTIEAIDCCSAYRIHAPFSEHTTLSWMGGKSRGSDVLSA